MEGDMERFSTPSEEYLPPLPTATSIRLISLKGSEEDSKIELSMETYDLSDEPVYVALSYTWGDPIKQPYTPAAPSMTVFVDGKEMLVTPNLYDALFWLRVGRFGKGDGPGDALPCWVDALCINQSDLAERSHQVSMMGRIYAQANLVITWAGKGDEHGVAAIELIWRLQAVVNLWKTDKPAFTGNYDSDELYERVGISKPTPEEWFSLHRFYDRQLFKRVWVIQEVSLACVAVLMLGHYVIEWIDMMGLSYMMASIGWTTDLAAFMLAEGYAHGPKMLRACNDAPRLFTWARYRHEEYLKTHGGDQKHSTVSTPMLRDAYELLEDFLRQTNLFQATDPRDSVYATLSVVSFMCGAAARHESFLRPDYSSSVREVFVEATKSIIINTQSISILSLVDIHCRLIDSLPSWVPDYSAFDIGSIGAAQSAEGDCYRGFDLSQRCCNPAISADNLFVNALKKDELVDLASFDGSLVDGALRLCLRLPEVYINQQPRSEALCRTILGDRAGSMSPVPEYMINRFPKFVLVCMARRVIRERGIKVHELPEYASLIKLNPAGSEHPDPWLPRPEDVEPSINATIHSLQTNDTNLTRTDIFLRATESIIGRRRLFRTSTNMLGLGPESMQHGDSIWFIPSYTAPFVLRRDAGGHYRLIGDAYLHGFMHGEISEVHGPLQRISLA